jgi:cell division protein FtsL
VYVFIFIVIVLSAIALWLFQHMNQRRKIRQEEMHERKRRQFEELLKLVSEKKPADAGPGVQESDPPAPGSGRAGTTEGE